MKARYRWASVIGALMLTAMTGACSWARNDVDLARAPEQGTWGVHPQAGLGAVCRQTIAAARQRLQALPTTSMMVVVDGKQLFGYGALDRPSIVYSVRKSILAMLYGRYVDSGVIDLDRTLGELGIDDTGGLLPVERRARLRDLLASRSGVYHAAANPGDDADHVPPRGSQEPGSYFLYNNWDFNAAGTAFEMATGQDIYAAFARDIAAPLHMEDFQLSSQHKHPNASRSVHPAYHFLLSTRDMSRLGQLMLQQGRWDGQQLIPQDWVDAMLRPVTPAAQMHPPRTAERGLDYGLLWWVLDEPPSSPLAGAYMAWGYYGQFILVVPGRRMVIAHKRDVKPGGGDVARVRPAEFLALARMFADADCP